MLINRLPPTIKKIRYDFNCLEKVKLMGYLKSDSLLMLVKRGSLNSYEWLNFRHVLLLKYPFIRIFRGSPLELADKRFFFLNSNSYWVFILPSELSLSYFLDYVALGPKKPSLLTLILRGSFLNLTGKLDPYVFLNTNIREKRNALGYLAQTLWDSPRDITFFCLHMTYILLLSIVLLIRYLWSLCELFITYPTKLC